MDIVDRLREAARTGKPGCWNMLATSELYDAADEIGRLRELVASLEQYEAMVLGACGELETFEEYRASLSKLMTDAARYRWLRSDKQQLAVFWPRKYGHIAYNDGGLDSVVDEVMRQP